MRRVRALYRAVEAVVLVAAAVALVGSERVRGWAASHGEALYLASLVLLAVVVVLADLWWAGRGAGQRHEPTRRDRELFERFEREFPLDGGGIAYLRDGFFGKRWSWARMSNVLDFADGWGHTVYFDDPEVEAARAEFHRVAADFYSDAAVESYAPEEERGTAEDRPAVLIDNRSRPQYSAEWRATRERLQDKAAAVVDANDRLHRLGRRRGL